MRPRLPKIIDPVFIFTVFYAYAHPDLRGPFKLVAQFQYAFRTLRQNLILMPVCALHHVKHPIDKTMFTELGVMMGTPEYMSPEQADQREQNIDTRIDVYSRRNPLSIAGR
jgi:serine/threonine protein kinase